MSALSVFSTFIEEKITSSRIKVVRTIGSFTLMWWEIIKEKLELVTKFKRLHTAKFVYNSSTSHSCCVFSRFLERCVISNIIEHPSSKYWLFIAHFSGVISLTWIALSDSHFMNQERKRKIILLVKNISIFIEHCCLLRNSLDNPLNKSVLRLFDNDWIYDNKLLETKRFKVN